jgi:CRISPR system Cascade subunit CasE
MFLSKLALNPRSRQARRELADPYQLHRTVLAAFPDEAEGGLGRVSFRVDTDRCTGLSTVLVQSAAAPDWSGLRAAGDYLLADPESKEFAPSFQRGRQLFFRLRANPTVKREGKRHAWLREEDQVAWLQRKARGEGKNSRPAGFEVLSVRVVPEGVRRGRKGNGPDRRDLSLFSVLFEGILAVTDPDAFHDTLVQGIGSGKAFGFGLLSLARVPA